jgi:hypothetical protein
MVQKKLYELYERIKDESGDETLRIVQRFQLKRNAEEYKRFYRKNDQRRKFKIVPLSYLTAFN